MTDAALKIAALERLASDAGAAPGERENARRAAERLREREPRSSPRAAASARPSGRVEQRGGVDCWVGEPPTHGRVCFQGPGGCAECNAIERWRRWLAGARE